MSRTADLSPLIQRADVCAVAVADTFRGDGEILANPIGTIAMIGGRLARATYEPDLMMTDGEAGLIANDEAVVPPADRIVETFNPYRRMFDVVWSGRRHVMMGATQVDQYGNQNIAGLGGTPTQPKTQLLGFRGGTGQHDQRHHFLLRGQPRASCVRRRRRHRHRDRVRPSRRTGACSCQVPRDPPSRVEPRCVRLRDTGPPNAGPLAASRSDPRRSSGGNCLRAGGARRHGNHSPAHARRIATAERGHRSPGQPVQGSP